MKNLALTVLVTMLLTLAAWGKTDPKYEAKASVSAHRQEAFDQPGHHHHGHGHHHHGHHHHHKGA
jgi:hypothetical protein